MVKHTPGPWAFVDGHYPCMKEVIGPSFRISIVMSATDLDFNDFLKRSADAHLIAAAPDLLEALQQCAESMRDAFPDFDHFDRPAYKAAVDAIAKATGEKI